MIDAATARANLLLDSLTDADLGRLLGRLERVDIAAGTDLYASASEVSEVSLPLSGLCSLVAGSGLRAVDVGPIGFDGMVGLPTYLRSPSGPLSATVHVAGEAIHMSAESFQGCVDEVPAFDRVMRRYVQWTYAGMGVWVACARLHEVQERCARWLLMAHDRVRMDRFLLTQAYLAQMVGVRRPTLSIAASLLQDAGLIRYTRGVITIRDRPGLEDAACACYAIVTDDYSAIFGRSLRPAAATTAQLVT